MSAGPSPTWIRATTLFAIGEMRRTSLLPSETAQTEPAPTQRLYGLLAPVWIVRAILPVAVEMRLRSPLVSSAQSEP